MAPTPIQKKSTPSKKRLFEQGRETKKKSNTKRSAKRSNCEDSITVCPKSPNLLDTPPPVKGKEVKLSPTGMIVVPETEATTIRVEGNDKRHTELVERLMDDARKNSELIEKLKEHLETAITYSTACTKKLEKMYEEIATDEEVDAFGSQLHQKLSDVSKVVKKGVKLQHVSEIRIISEE